MYTCFWLFKPYLFLVEDDSTFLIWIGLLYCNAELGGAQNHIERFGQDLGFANHTYTFLEEAYVQKSIVKGVWYSHGKKQ